MELPPNNGKDGRPKGGRWKKGQSGNPAGRPVGARNEAALARERLLEDVGNQLIETAIEHALAGDEKCLKLCLDRLMPVCRQRTVHLPFTNLDGPDGLAGAMREVLKAVGRGELTPEEAENIARVVLAHSQILDNTDHERRLAALEARLRPETASGSR